MKIYMVAFKKKNICYFLQNTISEQLWKPTKTQYSYFVVKKQNFSKFLWITLKDKSPNIYRLSLIELHSFYHIQLNANNLAPTSFVMKIRF